MCVCVITYLPTTSHNLRGLSARFRDESQQQQQRLRRGRGLQQQQQQRPSQRE